MDIGQFLPEAGLYRYAPALQLQPVAKGGDQRRTVRLASRQSLAVAHATGLSLDPVKLGDPAQALGRDLGAVALEDLLQLAPCMFEMRQARTLRVNQSMMATRYRKPRRIGR